MLVLESVVSPRELSWSACGVPPLWPPDGLRQAGRLLPDGWLHYWPIPLLARHERGEGRGEVALGHPAICRPRPTFLEYFRPGLRF